MLTEMLIGKSLREAFQMTPEELDEALGGLPANKKFCAGLAIEALRRAIVFWTNHGSAKPGNP
jgi:nitrogen fixation NifU-like protein